MRKNYRKQGLLLLIFLISIFLISCSGGNENCPSVEIEDAAIEEQVKEYSDFIDKLYAVNPDGLLINEEYKNNLCHYEYIKTMNETLTFGNWTGQEIISFFGNVEFQDNKFYGKTNEYAATTTIGESRHKKRVSKYCVISLCDNVFYKADRDYDEQVTTKISTCNDPKSSDVTFDLDCGLYEKDEFIKKIREGEVKFSCDEFLNVNVMLKEYMIGNSSSSHYVTTIYKYHFSMSTMSMHFAEKMSVTTYAGGESHSYITERHYLNLLTMYGYTDTRVDEWTQELKSIIENNPEIHESIDKEDTPRLLRFFGSSLNHTSLLDRMDFYIEMRRNQVFLR